MIAVAHLPLTDTVALVTGASSGIGEATALALAAQGASVALGARRLERLQALAQRIEADGGHALAIEADVTDPAAAQNLVDTTVAHFGRLDTLINNAGLMLLDPAVGAELSDWDRMVRVNIDGVLNCAHAAMDHLLAAAQDSPRGVADMVNVSSTAGRQTRSGSAVYNLTKHAVGAFSDALRQEVTGRHLRVSLIEPGATETELRDHLSPDSQAAQAKRFETMEPLQAADIADAITYIVTRPRHVAVNEMLVRPTEQV
jgi:NADP-dependent 3-hydroxy acid dehydrogenase YdfG